MNTRTRFLRSVCAVGVLCVSCAAVAAPLRRPNVIVVMADDLGYADVGFQGCEDIPTPHLDSIAANGVRFTNGYVSYPVCGPSRAGFMTGRYQQRFGFERNPQYKTDDLNMGLPLSEKTIADVLKTAGYRSGIIGKWHLGAHPKLHPLNRGFDFFFGHLGGGHQYFPKELTIRDSYAARNENESYRTWILRDHEPVKISKYLTDEFSDEAVRFVERNRDKPFFLFLSYNAPHGPLQATEEYLARFPDIKDRKRKTYAAMVSALDDGVGRLLAKLGELELTDQTLLFFLSDNGGPVGKNGSNNRPLRGGKSDVWEGGIRVPFAVQWPGTIPQGVTYDHPVISLDICATAVEVAGASAARKGYLDGVNLIPFLTGESADPAHRTITIRKFDQSRFAVRRDNHKLVIPWKGGPPQLYDLSADIAETKNLAASRPEVVAMLEQVRTRWDATLIEPRFLGLIHTPEWQKRMKRNRKGTKK